MKKYSIQFIILSLTLFGSGVPASVYAASDEPTASETLESAPDVHITVSQVDDRTVITFDTVNSTCKISVASPEDAVTVVQDAPDLNLNFPASCLDISINSSIKSLATIKVLPQTDNDVEITVKSEPLTMGGPVIVPRQQSSDAIQNQTFDVPTSDVEPIVRETEAEDAGAGEVLKHEIDLSFLQVYRC